ncbi:MAG: TRAP transporter substrate-binding protein DctP [Myxococcota bacterium]
MGRCLPVLVFAVCLLSADSSATVAQESQALRLATLAPRGSKWMRVFEGWAATLREETGGRLALRVEPGGPQVDDRALVRRMRSGRLDGATLAASGLRDAVPAALVFAAPGLDPEGVGRARSRLADELEAAFRERGYHLLGWVDLGQARLFSKGAPVRSPGDLREMKPWARSDDAVFSALLAAAGARPVRAELSQVRAALGGGRVDVVPASALTAVSTGWYTALDFVTKEPLWTMVGATVIRRASYTSLSDEERAALDRSGARAHEVLQRVVEREERDALKTLTGRGIRLVPRRDARAWASVASEARARMAGRVVPEALLRRVRQIAGAP